MSDDRRRKIERLRNETVAAYGQNAASLGGEKILLNSVPSPSLMLDYKLGTGGFPYRYMVEVFGGNGLGKTTCLGYGTLANVQREGKIPVLVAMEPNFDPDWAFKLHGLDPNLILVQRPDDAVQAFDMLYELVHDPDVDYILLDSIGAMSAPPGEKDPMKKQAYGVSAQVTDGLNKLMPRLWKSGKGMMILNQQRQAGQGQGGTWYESPGGEGLKHHAGIRIHLKPGPKKYYATVDGQKEVLVGRELKCVFKKNKVAEAANKAAEFDFYNIYTEKYDILGVDKVSDVIKVGKLTGVIQPAGSWLEHGVFPKGKIQGVPKAREFFRANPEAFAPIREDVMAAMVREELEAEEKNAIANLTPGLEAVADANAA